MLVYTTVCLGVVAIIFLSNWPSYNFQVRGGPIPLWYYVLPGVLILPVIVAEPGSAVRFFTHPILWWFVAYVATGMVWMLFAQDFIEESAQQWRLRLMALFFLYTVTIFGSEAHRNAIGWIILACVLAACAFNWFDVMRPHRFVPEGHEASIPGRGAGFFMNPNAAAAFIVMGTIAALPVIPTRLRGPLLVVAVFGVAATFSRSGFVLIALTLLLAVVLRLVTRTQTWLLVVGIPLLVSGVSMSYEYLVDASDNRGLQTVVQRLAWFQDGHDEDVAVEGRRYGASRAWEMFLEEPVTGHGTGATSIAAVQEGPHNMYLKLAAEQGLLGFALYVALIAILIRRGWRLSRNGRTSVESDLGKAMLIYGAFLTVYGLFSHNVLEEPHTMFCLAFIIAAAWNAERACDAADSVMVRLRRVGRPFGSAT
jgi:O-antigen ligase